ncbi:hypothetical protein [Polaromonas sp.]|uniref:hypothetical protein n=1 Tax=Polaromonas sp. TaxID=1869339 RepID=UPI00352AFE51
MNSAIPVAVAHLNAPYGQILTAEDLTAALRAGSFTKMAHPSGSDIAAAMFIELEPEQLLACVNEVGGTLRGLQGLYEESLSRGLARVPGWEQTAEQLL